MERTGGGAAWILKVLINIFWGLGLIFSLIFAASMFFNLIFFTGWELIIGWLHLLMINILILVIIINLREIIKTLLAGRPFILRNVMRFRAIGFFTIVVGILYLPITIVNVKQTGIVIFGADQSGITMPTIAVFLFFFFGLFSLVLSEIFKLSYEIKEESKLTI